MLDRGDALHLRRVLARAVLSSTAAASMPTQQSMAMRRLVEQSDKQATREEDPAALRVLIVNRRKRRIGNVNELVRAIRHDADSPLQRRCLPLSGACDLGWHVHSIQHTLMEGMSAPEQVSGGDNMSPPVQYQGRVPLWALVHSAALVHLSQTSTPNGNLYPLSRYFPCALCYLPLLQVAMWLGGPNVVIVPHGAGSTHATYLPPVSLQRCWPSLRSHCLGSNARHAMYSGSAVLGCHRGDTQYVPAGSRSATSAHPAACRFTHAASLNRSLSPTLTSGPPLAAPHSPSPQLVWSVCVPHPRISHPHISDSGHTLEFHAVHLHVSIP